MIVLENSEFHLSPDILGVNYYGALGYIGTRGKIETARIEIFG